jgi:hypothetical protein
MLNQCCTSRARNKAVLRAGAMFFIAVVVLTISGCSQDDQKHEAVQVSERVKRNNARLLELASQHHASVDWLESLPDRGMGGVFTIDLTKALVRTNGQPVAMIVNLEDVSDRDGAFIARFFMLPSLPSGIRHYHPLHLLLLCNTKQAEYLLKSKPAIGYPRFAVVATIESVSRPALEAVASENSDTFSFDFDSAPPDVFFAKGICVDLALLE